MLMWPDRLLMSQTGDKLGLLRNAEKVVWLHSVTGQAQGPTTHHNFTILTHQPNTHFSVDLDSMSQ